MARDRLAAMRAQQASTGGQQQMSYRQLDSYGDAPAPPSIDSRPASNRPSFEGYSINGAGGAGGMAPNPRAGPPRGFYQPQQAPAQPTQDRWQGGAYDAPRDFQPDPYPTRDYRPSPEPMMAEARPLYYNDPPPRPPPQVVHRGMRPGREGFTDPFQASREDMREPSSSTVSKKSLPLPLTSSPEELFPARATTAMLPVGAGGPRAVSSTDDFFDGVAALQARLRDLHSLIASMAEAQRRALDAPTLDARSKDEVAYLAECIRSLSNEVKRAIQGFEADHSLLRQRGDPDGDVQVRMQQLAAVKARFVEAVQRYAEVEQGQRRAIRAKVERQLRVVKPDASDFEIRAAIEDEENGGAMVFQQAIAGGQRTGAARNALREVQSRGEDIKRIERTITELAQLFNDLALMVEEQDATIIHIEQKTVEANRDVEGAVSELKTAVVSARAARNKRKCCFFITLGILVAVGIVIAVMVVTHSGPFH